MYRDWMRKKTRFTLGSIIEGVVYIALALYVLYAVFTFFHRTEFNDLIHEDEILKLTKWS